MQKKITKIINPLTTIVRTINNNEDSMVKKMGWSGVETLDNKEPYNDEVIVTYGASGIV